MSQQTRPDAIGRYQILDVVGSGAMGTVYKAHDPSIRRDVAIKVVRIDADSAQGRAAAIDRFRVEVQAAGRCSHSAIVGVYDFLDQLGDPAIVMELVDGTSLLRTMRDPERRAAYSLPSILHQVLEGLGYAHDQGIIHRDIKPANILVTPSGQAKIADFGVARLAGANATLTGAMFGTPSYMAPEQLIDDRVDHRADLFAVGAILYEMLAGKSPFAGRTVPETMMRLSGPNPADMAPVVAAGSGMFVPVLRQALAKDRERRFQTARAFLAALQAASSGSKAATEDDPGATIVMASQRPNRAAFDPSFLQRVELHLARFVGPIARTMVTQAARQTDSPGDLYALLARDLPDAANRSLFLRLVGGGRVEPSLGERGRPGQTMAPRTIPPRTMAPQTMGPETMAPQTMPPPTTQPRTIRPEPVRPEPIPSQTILPQTIPPQTMPPRTFGAGSIPPAATAAAQAALVQYVGPIARVLVRDAAAQATSRRDFIDRLCAHVTKSDERAALQRRLRAEVEPKLI
jgi:eukaryotic-like serine/threonine-protein kinase